VRSPFNDPPILKKSHFVCGYWYTETMLIKAALLLFRDGSSGKELLFARAKDKTFFVFPGGKQETNETIDETLQRELQEELGTQAENIRKLGVISGQTPDGRDIEMHLYTGKLLGDPSPHAEVEEIAWMSKDDITNKQELMTPMTMDHVLPFLAGQNIW
jgi:8-oxo-dGTP diphosphatase